MVTVMMIIAYQNDPAKQDYNIQVADEHYFAFLQQCNNDPNKIFIWGPGGTILTTRPNYMGQPLCNTITSWIENDLNNLDDDIVIYIDDFSQVVENPPTNFRFSSDPDNIILFSDFSTKINTNLKVGKEVKACIIRGNMSGSAHILFPKTYCSMKDDDYNDFDQYSQAYWLMGGKTYLQAHNAEKTRLTSQNPIVQTPVP